MCNNLNGLIVKFYVMKTHFLILFLICFFLAGFVFGQTQPQPEETLVVQSWKKGTEKIHEQTLRVELTPDRRSYTKDVSSESGKVYRLSIKPDLLNDLKGENWVVVLNEVTRTKRSKKEKIGFNLLQTRPSGWTHEFFQEDKAGYFYPNEGNHIIVNSYPWIEGVEPLYPLKMIRQFIVDGFLVTLSVGKVVFDENAKEKIKNFEIFVKF